MLKTKDFRAWAVVALALVAATVLALLTAVAVKPAQAAYPGSNGAIAYTSGVTTTNLDIYRIDPDGFGYPGTNLTSNMAATSESMPAWSSEGTRIAFASNNNSQGMVAGTDHEIWWMTARGEHQTQLTDNALTDLEPSWFPTDTRIAFRRNNAGGGAHIWVLHLDSDGNFVREEQLTSTSGSTNNLSPAVSPSGGLIAFASNRTTSANPTGDYEIFVMKTDGTGVKQLTKTTNGNPGLVEENQPEWSPDGRRIAFQCTRGGTDTEICVMKADGTGQKVLTDNTFIDGDPAFSPDGRRISFERDLGANNRDLWRMRADGANEFNVTDDGTTRIDANPSWQPR